MDQPLAHGSRHFRRQRALGVAIANTETKTGMRGFMSTIVTNQQLNCNSADSQYRSAAQ